jgi:AAT family amino acid transporter
MWYPDVPTWIWALAALVIMAGVNLIAIKAYGEFEFWFALIKIIAIVLMIIAGLGMIIFGFGNGGIATGISNLWSNGGFAPHGFKGILMSMQMVMFAFLGIELIGVTAGEVKNPEKTIAKAVNTVFWRILLFYVGALFVIMSIYPWDQIGTQGSPFVLTFEKMGIGQAAGIINFVVLTAALSSCNSGIFSTGRMLFNLAQQKQAPQKLGKIGKTGVPSTAILVSAAALLIGVALNYLVPEKVFVWVTSISTFGAIWTWGVILVSQMKFRKTLSTEEKKALKFKMPFFPYGSYIALAILIFVVGIMAYFPDTRIALIVGPLWLALLTAIYYGKGFHKRPDNVDKAA